MVVGSQFGGLELWSISEKAVIKTINAHKDTVICLKKEKDVLLSASVDSSVVSKYIKRNHE